jgi:hypothetical protein
MKIEINKKILKIKILEKINELKKENIIDIFCIIWAFKIEEKKRGNEYDSAWIKIKYIKNLIITENINVFNIVRIPDLYSFVNYIKKIEKNFDSQNTETKINLDDYFTQTENISQEIVILMMFEIESEEEKIKETKEKLKNNLKMTGADIEIFDLIK